MTFMNPLHRVNDWARLGAVVRDARRSRHLTQQELAQRSGVSRGWLVRLEAGHPTAEPATVLRVLRALDLELVVRTTERTADQIAAEAALAAMLDG